MHGGMQYVRMMRRRNQSNFRFLHDEISGGLIALSKLRVKSTYTGDVTGFDGDSFGFLNDVLDEAAIAAALGSDFSSDFIKDQLNNDNFTGGGNWDNSE